MSWTQALLYFAREAALNLVRGWRVSLLAILTIAVSLFLGGVFLLVSGNLQKVVASWRGESKIVVYLESGSRDQAIEALRHKLEEPSWTQEVRLVGAEAAAERFSEAFPSLTDLLEGWGDDPLPASFEVRLDWREIDSVELETWLAALRGEEAVGMVDDDRDWLRQLEAVILVLRGLGLAIGAVLLLTAIFTISSIIRLTAYLYRDEIAVMRMVGATEFFIRGPFYMEGILQGLAGGLLAIAALFVGHEIFLRRSAGSLLSNVVAAEFLSPTQLLLLAGLGALAGLLGAATSLQREALGPALPEDEWTAAE